MPTKNDYFFFGVFIIIYVELRDFKVKYFFSLFLTSSAQKIHNQLQTTIKIFNTKKRWRAAYPKNYDFNWLMANLVLGQLDF